MSLFLSCQHFYLARNQQKQTTYEQQHTLHAALLLFSLTSVLHSSSNTLHGQDQSVL